MWRWVPLSILFALALVLAPAASAQTTGGSFGGGDFSSSSGGGSASSSGTSSSSPSDGDTGDGEAFAWALVVAAMLVWEKPLVGIPILLGTLLLCWAWFVADKRTKGWLSLFAWVWVYAITWATRVDAVAYIMAGLSVLPLLLLGASWLKDKYDGRPRRRARLRKRDVCVISLWVAPQVRGSLEARLEEIRSSKGSLFLASDQLRDTARALKEHRAAWRGGHWQDFVMRGSERARESYAQEVGKARFRAEEARAQTTAPEGAVVTLVVYSKSELPQLTGWRGKEPFADAVDALEGVSLFENRYEVVWAPLEGGSLGAGEMRQRYSEIQAFPEEESRDDV